MALSNMDNAYLKMGAQRALVEAEGQRHLQSVLLAIVQDHGFDKADFFQRYNVKAGAMAKGNLTRKPSGSGIKKLSAGGAGKRKTSASK